MPTPTRQSSDESILIARGYVGAHTALRKFGNNPAVGTSEEAIWDVGGSYTFLSAASAVRIKSGGDAADAAAGAGARKITVIGLDQDFNEVSEEIITAGASQSSATTLTFIRVFRAYISEVGTYGAANTGNIDIETTGGTTLGRIPAGEGQTTLGLYTVPAGKTAYIQQLHFIVPTSASVLCKLKVREQADDVAAPGMQGFRTRFVAQVASPGLFVPMHEQPIVVPEKSDILCTGQAASAPDKVVSVVFDVTLVQTA